MGHFSKDALKQRVKDFKGGTLVMTLPPPPHRCPPSPYERACLIASHIKKNKIPGKIVILDPKPKIAPIGVGYKQAFDELYERQRVLPDGPERLALIAQAKKLLIAYMPYKVHVHRIGTDLWQP